MIGVKLNTNIQKMKDADVKRMMRLGVNRLRPNTMVAEEPPVKTLRKGTQNPEDKDLYNNTNRSLELLAQSGLTAVAI